MSNLHAIFTKILLSANNIYTFFPPNTQNCKKKKQKSKILVGHVHSHCKFWEDTYVRYDLSKKKKKGKLAKTKAFQGSFCQKKIYCNLIKSW